MINIEKKEIYLRYYKFVEITYIKIHRVKYIKYKLHGNKQNTTNYYNTRFMKRIQKKFLKN